ncbi:MAG TPA: hypothetical protein VHL11_02780 [Phototrophicaceae bacterium]|nr:hypothetical protein [Phototrophicaceae bacterium]
MSAFRTSKSFMILLLIGIVMNLTACRAFLFDDEVSCDSDQFYGYVVPVPATAIDVQEDCSNGFNPTYIASFVIPVAELSAFQQSEYFSQITDWHTTVPDDSIFKSKNDKTTALLYGHYGDGAINLEVLIDMSDPEQYRVYVIATNVD